LKISWFSVDSQDSGTFNDPLPVGSGAINTGSAFFVALRNVPTGLAPKDAVAGKKEGNARTDDHDMLASKAAGRYDRKSTNSHRSYIIGRNPGRLKQQSCRSW
jgi:hypothetical protein